MNKLFELAFTTTDLGELQRLVDDLFRDNSIYFERLVSALSRIGLHTTIESHLELYPNLEAAKARVVEVLKSVKGVSHEK